MKNTTEIDWKFVAVECQRKLNLIAGELNSWKKNCSSADCSFMAAELVKKFHLDSESVGVPAPDYMELRKRLDSITGLLAQIYFAPSSRQKKMLAELSSMLGDFAFQFAIYGAFVSL